MKREYKNTSPNKGVCVIKNLIKRKIFLVRSPNLYNIAEWNKARLNFGRYSNKQLQKNSKIYGEKIFGFEILKKLKINN